MMRQIPDCSIDSVVTDPPYELNFMNHSWDRSGISYNLNVWREALRILKPGAHMLVFGSPRTYHRMACAVEDAGFEVRDQIMWIYGDGMPKNKNMLKPAHEPIVMVRKPFKGTLEKLYQSTGAGHLNIENCRVPILTEEDLIEFANNHAVTERLPADRAGQSLGMHDGGWKQRVGPAVVPNGRWPANIIHDGQVEFPQARGQIAKASTNTIASLTGGIYGDKRRESESDEPRDQGGSAGRFFYCAKATTKDREEGCEYLEMRELARSNQAQASGGQNAFNKSRMRHNPHPTVKPTALMQYLTRLITPARGTFVDMFAGSGSSGKGGLIEGFHPILIDNDPLCFPLIHARCAHAAATLFC